VEVGPRQEGTGLKGGVPEGVVEFCTLTDILEIELVHASIYVFGKMKCNRQCTSDEIYSRELYAAGNGERES
jgi:hypothetical protein